MRISFIRFLNYWHLTSQQETLHRVFYYNLNFHTGWLINPTISFFSITGEYTLLGTRLNSRQLRLFDDRYTHAFELWFRF